MKMATFSYFERMSLNR